MQTARLEFPLIDGSELTMEASSEAVEIAYSGSARHAIYVALEQAGNSGSAILPFAPHLEGSTVFLPLQATVLYCALPEQSFRRTWQKHTWSDRDFNPGELSIERIDSQNRIRIGLAEPGQRVKIAAWVKDLRANDGWGSFIGSNDPSTRSGTGDKTMTTCCELTFDGAVPQLSAGHRRFGTSTRPRIYELFVRLFSNTNETRKPNGTLAENGCGRFGEIGNKAIQAIAEMGFTHIWLMGAVRCATTTDFSQIGIPPADTDLMKGLAGSPYSIRDYFDVCPDLAIDPLRRLDEFRDLVKRIHAHGLKVIVDFVGNHVSRAYSSTVRPDLTFGLHDDRSKFFARDNNFYWLRASDPGGGPPLRLPTFDPEQNVALSPTCYVLGDCDGRFAGEMEFGKVTGDNRVTWAPDIFSWYETVKLNYGFDFTDPSQQTRLFPHAGGPDEPIPDTWHKIDAVLAYWQQLGVDGFRCDMAHMVPPEFWAWSIARARERGSVLFLAEAYDDLVKVCGSDPHVRAVGGRTFLLDLLNAGFDAVYGHDAYQVVKAIYEGGAWANDLDRIADHEMIFHSYVRYAENHDEVRLASALAWGGHGMEVGRAVSALLYGLSRGPVLFYNGQEVGEPAAGEEGFGGDDARTTLFDYWSMPELSKWVNQGAFDGAPISDAARNLRSFYARLIHLAGEPAFRDGVFFGLNAANIENPAFGRIDGETASGHWLYACLRGDAVSGQRFVVLANLHPHRAITDLRIRFPAEALELMDIAGEVDVKFVERLCGREFSVDVPGRTLMEEGLALDEIPALTAFYFEQTDAGRS